MTIYHKHHIIPRHMGGSDDPDNLIELTIEEHADAHRKLFELHGRPQDFAAWQGLSGIMRKSEIVKYLQSEGAKELANRRKLEGTHPRLGDKNPSKKRVKSGTHHSQQNVGNRPVDLTHQTAGKLVKLLQ